MKGESRTSRITQQWQASATLLLCWWIAGCAALPRQPVPVAAMDRAAIPGMTGVRAWAGQLNEYFQDDLVRSLGQEVEGTFPVNERGLPVYPRLALSGGGANGAFGAGVLCGWTESGDRPVFKMVTGISTGALIAPFAFLGSDYDETLRTVYTTIQTRDILEWLNIFQILSKREAFSRTTPLRSLIESNFNADFLAAVAEAHNQGRRLYVGTTHMDAQTLIAWNMGAIAASGHPDAVELFQKIVLASSSIPGAFPPVLIDVEIDGETYDEMHTDGGTVTQVFFSEGMVDLRAAHRAAGRGVGSSSGTLYVIINGLLDPQPQQVKRRLPEISGRALSTMIKFSARDDLYRIFLATQANDLDFRYLAIPDGFRPGAEELFDPVEMGRLFDLGYQVGLTGDGWRNAPPTHRHDDESDSGKEVDRRRR